ncbi:GNAT family N-acetyltransferase [Nocardia thailandica]|uniref:GNAT family N-acetyltransferase n=1 Tax=Nocardia thailandica TaxID=257275 RepID=UPI0002E6CC11|nr:GNAT family N-acetyltransferase [Nocardia thailandica]
MTASSACPPSVTYTIPTGTRARIEDVVVDESARGKGVAFELTNIAVELARQAGARTVDLTSRPSRESANRLYGRAGFTARDSLTCRQTLSITEPTH